MSLTINNQPSGLAFTKSPLLVKMTSTNADETDFIYKLEVTIWNGVTAPSEATYILSKLPNVNISNSALFNIGKLVEAEINNRPPSGMTADSITINQGLTWVKVVAKAEWDGGSESTTGNTFTATLGYTFTEDETMNYGHGLGQTSVPMTRPANTKVYFGYDFFIPLVREYHTTLELKYGATTQTFTPTDTTTNSANRIRFYNATQILEEDYSHTGDFEFRLSGASDDTGWIKVIAGNESKHVVIPVIFLNRYGLWEVLYMTKKMVRTNTINSRRYHSPHFTTNNTINMSRKGQTTMNETTEVSYTLNSDIVSEQENDMYLDLFRSSYVCLYIDGKYRQVYVDDKTFAEKTSLNDKIINHTIRFKLGYSDENMIF